MNSIPIIRPPVAANCLIYVENNISEKKQLAKLFRFAGEPRLKFMEKQRPCGCLNEHFSFLVQKLVIKDPETLTQRSTKYKSEPGVSYSNKSLTTRWQVFTSLLFCQVVARLLPTSFFSQLAKLLKKLETSLLNLVLNLRRGICRVVEAEIFLEVEVRPLQVHRSRCKIFLAGPLRFPHSNFGTGTLI